MAEEKLVPAADIVSEFSNISRNDFPEYFIFGTGTAAYQTEGAAQKGGRGPSVWDTFTLQTPGISTNLWIEVLIHFPGVWDTADRITDGSNGNVAVDMYHRYEDDFRVMKSMGFDSYRFSISWPRILPNGRVSLGVNNDGIDFYNNYINCLLANDIEPYVTLFHWDLPMSLQQEYGGFLSKKVVHDFREFAEFCFWNFGDRVKKWITLNEPWTYTVHGYVDGMFPPGEGADAFATASFQAFSADSQTKRNYILYKSIDDPQLVKPLSRTKSESEDDDSKRKPDLAIDVYTVARNLLVAHAAASDSYRTKFKEQQKGQIGITVNSYWFEPYNDTPEDQKAVKRALDFMLGWFLEPVLIGQYPKNMINYVPTGHLAPFSDKESEMLKGSIDFLGLNYYTANYAENDPHASFGRGEDADGYYEDQQVAFYTEKNGVQIGPPTGSNWQFVVPSGIHKLLKYVNAAYNNTTYNLPPIYVTENGVGETSNHKLTAQEASHDKFRVNFFQAHLGNILKAINEDKVDVRGYFLWSWVDNFEWVFGYTIRFGITYIDYVNHLNRHPKDSAIWYTKFLVKTKKMINNAWA